MRCSNCGAQLNANAKFCAHCGTRVLAQKTDAGSQNVNNNNKYGSSNTGTAAFEGADQSRGMEQHAGSRASQMDAAYSSMRENPENTVRDQYTSAYGSTPQGSEKYRSRGGNEYTSAYESAPQGSEKYRSRGGDEYTSAFESAPQEPGPYSSRGGNEYTSAFESAPQEPGPYSSRGGNEHTSAFERVPQEPYSSQDRQTSSTTRGAQNFDDTGTVSFGSTGADIYTENLRQTTPDSEPAPQFSPVPENPYISQNSPSGDGDNPNPKSRFSILILGEIIAILAVGAVLIFLLLGKFDSVVTPKDDTKSESQKVERESTTASNDSKSSAPVTVTPTSVPTNTPTPTPTSTPTPTPTPTVPTSAPVPTAVPTSTPPPSTPVPQPSVETISCYNGVQAPADEFVFPYSSQRYLTQSELDSLLGGRDYMHMQSQLAINEIFARYGYTFVRDTETAQDARNHFEGRSWYVTLQGMCPTNNSDDLKNYYMNAYEQANIKTLNEWQQMHDVYY